MVGEPSVWVEGPSVVEAIYNQKGNELRVSLVNGVTARPSLCSCVNIVEVIPIMWTKIVVNDKRVRRAADLDGRELPVRAEKRGVVITVPRLDQYDLISLEVE
jgi:hypothetical protein